MVTFMKYQISNLPLKIDLESKVILKKVGEARSAFGYSLP
jgi:hypothetical protein